MVAVSYCTLFSFLLHLQSDVRNRKKSLDCFWRKALLKLSSGCVIFFSVGSFCKEQGNMFFHDSVAFDLSGQGNDGWRADDKPVVEQTDLNFFWSLFVLVLSVIYWFSYTLGVEVLKQQDLIKTNGETYLFPFSLQHYSGNFLCEEKVIAQMFPIP